MRALIEQLFLEGAEEPVDGVGLAAMDDGAAIRVGDRWLVLTTDSHVIHPLFFPGGDIGRLSVSGTVNDLAMMGATEVLALTCSVILEDGFPSATLEAIQASIRATSREARAPIVTGDTKVMGRGELDGLVLNTAGRGLHRPGGPGLHAATRRPDPGDRHHGRPRLRGAGRSPQAGPPGRAALRRGAPQRAGGRAPRRRRCGGGGDEGPHPGRSGQRTARDGGEERGGGGAGGAPGSPHRPGPCRSRAPRHRPACTWPTRARR